MHGKIVENQYLDLLKTLSSNIWHHEENSIALKFMNHAKLVSHVFSLLEYLQPKEGEIETSLMNDNARK